MKNVVLIVAAHPDDEVIGCGGSILGHIKEGDEVHLLSIADGVSSRHYDANSNEGLLIHDIKDILINRKKEMHDAIKLLGMERNNVETLDLPDQRLDSLPLLDIIKKIEAKENMIKPNIVYTHHWGDLNKDHRVVLEAVLTCFRPSRKDAKKTLIRCYEINGNMNIMPPKGMYSFDPDRYNDISNYMEYKISALKAYKSELAEAGRPTSPENIVDLALKRGKEANCKYAEAFKEIVL